MGIGNPPQQSDPDQASNEGRHLDSSQRIAVGALARSTGEVVAKLASLVFYVAVARELGEEQFGDFVFALSLSSVLLVGAGLGMQELIAREVARDRRSVDELLWNVVVLKSLLMLVLLMLIAVVVTAQGDSLDVGLATLIVSFGVGLEYQANSFYAVLQGYERQHYVAVSLIVNRISTAALGIGVLAAGWGLVAVAIVFTVGSALGVATAYLLMRRFVVRPGHEIDARSWSSLIRTSFPLGVLSVLGMTSFRSSVVLLGLLTASSAEVGEYGAAFRLIEATLFVSSSLNSALLPWFSRHSSSSSVPVSRGVELSLNAMIAVMLPVALAFALFANPLIENLFGAEYHGAVAPLRILAPVVVLWSVNGVIMTVLIGRDRPSVYSAPAAIAIILGLVLSFLLIPPLGAKGAALASLLGAALLVGLTVPALIRLIGWISPLRVAVAPLGAGLLMALVALLLTDAPWVPAAVVASVTYGAAFLTIERIFFPSDFAYYARVIRVRGAMKAAA